MSRICNGGLQCFALPMSTAKGVFVRSIAQVLASSLLGLTKSSTTGVTTSTATSSVDFATCSTAALSPSQPSPLANETALSVNGFLSESASAPAPPASSNPPLAPSSSPQPAPLHKQPFQRCLTNSQSEQHLNHDRNTCTEPLSSRSRRSTALTSAGLFHSTPTPTTIVIGGGGGDSGSAILTIIPVPKSTGVSDKETVTETVTVTVTGRIP